MPGPIARPDTARVPRDTATRITVLANDDGGGLAVIGVDSPSFGTVALNPDQSLTYTPAAGYVGPDNFAYTVRDADGATAAALVALAVEAPNRPPTAADDRASVAPGGSVLIPALANDADPDGDALRVMALDLPTAGSVGLEPDGRVRYVPQAGFEGTDAFAYTVADGRGGVARAAVTVTVAAANRPPTAAPDRVTTARGQPVVIDVLANDADPDRDPLRLAALVVPAHGVLAVEPGPRLRYTPAPGFEGTDAFAYTVADGRGGSARGEVEVTVVRPNAAPLAAADAAATEAGRPVAIDVAANDNDPDGDPLALTALELPGHGAVAVGADGRLTYTPAAGFTGTDGFAYTVADGRGGAATAAVTVRVDPPARPTTYLNGYLYRRRLVIPAGTVAGRHDHFPLLVSESGAWLRTAAAGGRIESAQGFDLRVEADDGTRLDHDLELYDGAAGRLVAWVRLPRLDGAVATRLWLYYGKPGLAAGEADPAGVWREHLAVWHLPDGRDRTGQGRDLTAAGTVGTGSLIGPAAAFTGAGVLTRADAGFLDGHAALTCQVWLKPARTGTDKGLLAVGPIAGKDDALGFGLRYDAAGFSGGGVRVVTCDAAVSDGRFRLESPSELQTTAAQALTLVWARGKPPRLYADGAAVEPGFVGGAARAGTTAFGKAGPLTVGAGALDAATGGWDGLIDEVRFTAAELAPERIAAEHASQREPRAFYGLGGEDAFGTTSRAPVALPLALRTGLGAPVEIDTAALGLDADAGQSPTLAVGAPAHGTASVVGTRLRYVPAAGFAGVDAFAYTLGDGAAASEGRVTVTVEAAGAAPDRMWDDRLYGNPTHGDTVSPCQLKHGEPVAYVVPVQRSGLVDKVLWEMRRANAAADLKGSVGDYSQGDGGKIRLQLRGVGADGLPTATVLAETAVNAGVAEPLCLDGIRNPAVSLPYVWPLLQPVRLTAGERVAIWLENVRPDVSAGKPIPSLPGKTFAGDWVSCNFLTLYAPLAFGRDHAGPYYKGAVELVRKRSWGAWQRYATYPQTGGLWELHYADGAATGNPYQFGTGALRKTVGGAAMVAQSFTVRGATRRAVGVWLRAFWTGAAPADLVVRLEEQGGALVEQLAVPAASVPQTSAFTGQPAAGWIYRPFAQARDLVEGRSYRLRLSAASGAYAVQPVQIAPAATGSRSVNRWEDSLAVYSTDGGASWKPGWDRSDRAGVYRTDVQLSVAFALA